MKTTTSSSAIDELLGLFDINPVAIKSTNAKPVMPILPIKAVESSANNIQQQPAEPSVELFKTVSSDHQPATPPAPLTKPQSLSSNNNGTAHHDTEQKQSTLPAAQIKTDQQIENSAVAPDRSIDPVRIESRVGTPTSGSSEHKSFSFLKQNENKLDMLLQDYKKLERHVELLSQKTLTSTMTLLEKEWKDLNDYQEKQVEANKFTISVARLYPAKNRFHDLLPYDQNRVKLAKPTSKTDDYINATHFGQLSAAVAAPGAGRQYQSPSFISTQMPLDFYEFWLLVLQEKCELVVCLCKDSEFEVKQDAAVGYYWPRDKQTPMNFSGIRVCLQSMKETEYSVQRVLTVSLDSVTRTVVVFQYLFNSSKPPRLAPVGTGLGANDMPDSVGNFLKFVKDCENFYANEQRNKANPVLTHCLNGVSRSAVLMLVYTVVQTIDAFYDESGAVESAPTTLAIADLLAKTIKQMRSKRKYMLQTVNHLTYAYECVLSYVRDTLIRKDVIKEDAPSVLSGDAAAAVKSLTGSGSLKKQNASPGVVGSNVLTLQDVCDPNKFCLDINDESSTRRKSKFTRSDFLQQI
jgi:protein tyrosine phosphatase